MWAMKVLCGALILIILSSACGVYSESTAVKPSDVAPSITYTPSAERESSVQQPEVTSTKVPVPTNTQAPTQDLQIGENGLIWAQVDGQQLYKLYDPVTGYIGGIEGDKRCLAGLMPGTTQEICNFEGKLGLLDLLTGEEQALDIQMPDWDEASPNGKFLFYGYVNQASKEQTIAVYDLEQHAQTKTLPALSYADWPDFLGILGGGLPSLSGNGESLVFVAYAWEDMKYYAYEYQIELEQIRKIDTLGLEFAGGLAWAGSQPLLLVGATDMGYADGDTDPAANHLFVYDPLTGAARALDRVDGEVSFDVFWQTHTEMHDVWSPDGEQILVFGYHQADETDQVGGFINLCIFNLELDTEVCDLVPVQAKNFPWLGNAAWSPDGKYVVFTMNRGALSGGELMIYSLEERGFVVIDEHPNFDGLYWRR
jgi:hypothetical protein